MKTGKKETTIKNTQPKELSGKHPATVRDLKLKAQPGQRLNTVTVPASLEPIFLKAQDYVERYFQDRQENPKQGQIEISGERYVLVRAASMSREFLDLVTSLYKDRGKKEARNVAFGFLFDMAHAIGKADARSFYTKMGVSDPIEKLSAGPIHFAYTGWASVKIYPDSHPTPDENYFLIYDHPFSFEANTWMKKGKKTDFSVCIMSAGYSSGWCEESFGIPLVAVEIECRAKGDEHCRFLMAPASRIEKYIEKYSTPSWKKPDIYGDIDVPEFFQRKRLEDELRRHRDHLEDLVSERTTRLIKINKQLQKEITERKDAERALQKSETLLRGIFDQTFQFIGILKLDGTVVKINKTAMGIVKTNGAELVGKPFRETPWWNKGKEEQNRLQEAIGKAAQGQLIRFETLLGIPDGQLMHIDFSIKPLRDDKGKIVHLIAEGRDITEFKKAMEDLRKREAELKTQSGRLEEANIALKVVLKQMEEKKREDKENILNNLKQAVIPYLSRFKKSSLSTNQMVLMDIVEKNLNSIASPLVSKLSSTFLNLTPMEIRIATLIKEGLMNKEITELLGTSLNTVSSHRFRIRTKLGLKKKGANLRSYLLSLDE
jgi:PAS domain S-box-containing protein